MSNDLSHIACVLTRYGPAFPPRMPLERQAGGFSGAGVWKASTAAGDWCLRRWPEGAGPAARLRGLHRLLSHLRAEGLVTVAPPVPNGSGDTLTPFDGRLWQLEPWLAGRADFRDQPTGARLTAAMHALAHWHLAAARFAPSPQEAAWFARQDSAPSPSVSSRLEIIREWLGGKCERLEATLRREGGDSFSDMGRRLLTAFFSAAPHVAAELAAASSLHVPLQPCLRDVWHDHVLYEGETVAGLIDPSACRTETVAADLSRLLGSLLGDDGARWEEGLSAYDRVRPLSGHERRLARILDRSGVLLSGMTWLDRHYLQRAPIAPVAAVAERLNQNLGRLESLARCFGRHYDPARAPGTALPFVGQGDASEGDRARPAW